MGENINVFDPMDIKSQFIYTGQEDIFNDNLDWALRTGGMHEFGNILPNNDLIHFPRESFTDEMPNISFGNKNLKLSPVVKSSFEESRNLPYHFDISDTKGRPLGAKI